MDYFVIDLDGPNYRFLKNLAIVAAEVTGRDVSEFPDVQDEWSSFIDNWKITESEFRVLFAIGVNNGALFWEGEPTEGAVEGWLDLACRDDTYIHVVTDRNPFGATSVAHEATNFWLATHGLYYDQISFRADKVEAVRDNIAYKGFDEADLKIYTIDDKSSNCMAFADAGWKSFVYDLPSNLDIDLPRVSSMLQFANVAGSTG